MKKKLTKFDWFEAMDRAAMLQESVDRALVNHQVFEGQKDMQQTLDQVFDRPHEIYVWASEEMDKCNEG